MRKTIVLIVSVLLAGMPLCAEEGMWLVTDPDAEGARAVVSMDFIGTGSVISPDGLLITNHHVAYGDLAALNLLESGFCARTRAEELRIPGKKVQILRRMEDVTAEVEALKDSLTREGVRFGSRRLSALMGRRHSAPGMEVSLESMWAGKKYYLAVYQVYDDVRLVLAPPVSIAAFGGDEDNWEWPQQKADFTLYRIYENGKPLDSPWHLKIAAGGVQEGDATQVIGYPGRTRRYSSSFELEHEMKVRWPLAVRLRGRQMEIIRKGMDADTAVRRKYSDRFFNLSNFQEYQAGELDACRRYGVIAGKQALERELAAWIAADPARTARWGNLLSELERIYGESERLEGLKSLFQETLIRGTTIAPTLLRMHNAGGAKAEEIYAAGVAQCDPEVEKQLLSYALAEYFGGMDPAFLGTAQEALHQQFGNDWEAFAAYLWDRPQELAGFLTEVKITAFRTEDTAPLRSEYTRALYEMRLDKGLSQYPDANSTLRVSRGKVCPLVPRDAVRCSWFSTARGIFRKADPARHDFAVPTDFLTLLQDYDAPVNFITDDDITGGNSGSPVLNARGELVGLAFDGNKESLSSDVWFVPEVTRCVCVDIRYILFILERYCQSTDLLSEMAS